MASSGAPSVRSASLKWVLEEEGDADSPRRALFSAIVTLTLGVLGSTILPMPYAIARTGVLPGIIIMLLVAYVNGCTCCFLVRAAAATGRTRYEELAEWAGGKKARVLTQVSLILLLYGTLCGGLAFLADVARMMVLKGLPMPADLPPPRLNTSMLLPALAGAEAWSGPGPGHAQAARSLRDSLGVGWTLLPWLEHAMQRLWAWFQRTALPVMRQDGRPLMLLVVATVLYPLCLQRHIRQFEKAATVGVLVLVVLMGIVVSNAIRLGFPAVAAGELPIWGFHSGGHQALPEAFSVLGLAFYMQPMLMPLLAEMPPGETGRRVSERAVYVVLYGVACAAYGTVGVFGAATYGNHTKSNIMVNDLLADMPTATLLLYGALLVYLCCGMVTTHYALRASLQVVLVPGGNNEVGAPGGLRTPARALLTTCILLMALAVAVTFPTQAERIFALTGCTAVCLVCYVIPVGIHLVLHQRMHHHQHQQLVALAAASHLHRVHHPASAAANDRSGPSTGGQPTTRQHPHQQRGPPGGGAGGPGGACAVGEWERSSESSGPEFMLIPPVSPGGDTASAGSRLVTPTHQASPALQAGLALHMSLLQQHGGSRGSSNMASGEAWGRHGLAGGTAGAVGALCTPLLVTALHNSSMVGGWALQEGADPPPLSLWHFDNVAELVAAGTSLRRPSWGQLLALLALPALIITLGIGFSLAGLYVGAMDVWNAWHGGGAGEGQR